MSHEAETAHIRKMDGLLVEAQRTNAPIDWERYDEAVREADRLFGWRPESCAVMSVDGPDLRKVGRAA